MNPFLKFINSSEMDKTSDVSHGGSGRFSAAKRQSGIDGNGNSGVLIKSKNEKLRRLSSVGSKMDSLSLSTSSGKRVKLPKKFFDDDYNPVDHASVPRKLRSAIKKRTCESVSPPFKYPKKLGHTVKNRVELKAKDCTKKFNPCMQEDSIGSPEEAVVGPITKEEEEVVETLYALAGMFPNHDKANNSIILREKPSETKFLPVPAQKDEDCRLICQAIGAETADSTSKFESPPEGTMKMLPDSKQLVKEVDNSAPLVNLPMIFSFSNDDSTIERPSSNPMAKLPPWLANATCATQPLIEKESSILADRKNSWKTCTAHVYISCLIRDLKLPDGKEELPIQIKPDEGSKKESLPVTNNLQMVINGSAEKKSSNEAKNAIPLHNRLLKDQQQACTTSEMYTSHKQKFDVFSNSGGSCGVEASNVVNGYGNRAEPANRFHYLNSLAQDHMIIPQALPHSYSFTSYNDHLSAAAAQQVQMQLPPYYGMPSSGPPSHMTATALPKQQLWASQVAQPHYRPSEVSAANLHNWQNRRHESPAASQTVLPNSSRSKYVPNSLLQVFAPNYGQMAPQQLQFGPIASLLAPKRREPQRVPLGYEENWGLHFPNNPSSLQMLCNERL